MNKFTSGLIAGSLIGAAGLTYALSDKKTKKKVMNDGRRMANKAEKAFDSIADAF